MRIQTDLEFQQNEIKRLNKKYNIEMFSGNIWGGKAFAAEQNIREFKKLLFKSKKLHKATSSKRIEPLKIIKKVTKNLNNIKSQKYGYLTEEIEQKTIDNQNLLFNVKSHSERYKRADILMDKKIENNWEIHF